MALSRKLLTLSWNNTSGLARRSCSSLFSTKTNLPASETCLRDALRGTASKFRRTTPAAFSTSSISQARGGRVPPSGADPVDSNPIVEDYPDMKNRKTTPKVMEHVNSERIDLKDLLDGSTEKSPNKWASDAAPHTEAFRKERDQSEKMERPKTDPKKTAIVLFPGQGAQAVGMGKNLLKYPNVNQLYDVASEILGYNLLKLCLEGPMEDLSKTVYSQTAIFVTSVAALEKLKAEHGMAVESCVAAAGFSVGEYAALVFAGCLSFEDGVRLVKARAESMQTASEACRSGMMSVQLEHSSDLNTALQLARAWCQDKKDIKQPVCKVANYLFPEGRVLAGHIEALDFIEANAGQFKIKPLKRLAVSGAFHTELMEPAIEFFQPHVMQTKFQPPTIKLLSNVTAEPYHSVAAIPKLLIRQICSPVKWEQILHVIYERKQGADFPMTYEVGPGKQLGAMLKKNNAKAFASYKAIEV